MPSGSEYEEGPGDPEEDHGAEEGEAGEDGGDGDDAAAALGEGGGCLRPWLLCGLAQTAPWTTSNTRESKQSCFVWPGVCSLYSSSQQQVLSIYLVNSENI